MFLSDPDNVHDESAGPGVKEEGDGPQIVQPGRTGGPGGSIASMAWNGDDLGLLSKGGRHLKGTAGRAMNRN